MHFFTYIAMNYEEKQGDLFSCSESASLAHCISEDCRMGKGIATLFLKNFGGVADLKKQVGQGNKTGSVCVLERGKRFVYYLITKQLYFHKPTYESMRSSLEAMKAHSIHNQVSELCMPKIGCGLDGLKWEEVRKIIQEVFADSDIKITVYHL